MSKADKMLLDLGYKIIKDNDTEIIYQHETGHKIFIIKHLKRYFAHGYWENDNIICPVDTDVREHLALHEKLKELGWI